jgi:transcriptional regulator with GAF, ATPase, and Fis domain
MSPRDPVDLERRLQNVTERLLGAFEELDFLHSLAAALGHREVADLDAYLLGETRALFRADLGWVARRRGDRLAVAAREGIPPEIATELTDRLLGSLAEQGLFPYLVDDLPGALVRQPALRDLAEREGIPRGFLAVPLRVDTEILGAVVLGKRRPGDVFTAGDSRLLSTLAVQASLYIKNADLVGRLRSEAQNLGKRVRQLESDPRLRPTLDWIDGPSGAMRQVARQVEAAAGTDSTVLLLGESGTGKSLVARILHSLSPRRGGAFVEVNCGAVAPTLIESELFGHAKGAFTGADRARPGLFEEADHGTIFLDEVAELPPASQVKLLDVLERQRVRRVGENRDRSIDVRVIAATNADLTAGVRNGKIREDLFYRLNVLSFTIPPLRQRREDILPLARRFLEEYARETNRRVSRFSPAAEEALLAYPWPGNVRELRNAVERSLLLRGKGEVLESVDLPAATSDGGGGQTDGEALGGAGLAATLPPASGPLPDAMRDYEKRLILDALRRSGGVVAEAAERLGISRTNLHNKLRKHGLVRGESWREES